MECHNSGHFISHSPSKSDDPGCWRRESLCLREVLDLTCDTGLLDLCDTGLRFVLPPGEMFRACEAGWRPRVRAMTCWSDFTSHQFMDCFSGILEELETVSGERMALAPLVNLLLSYFSDREEKKTGWISGAWFGIPCKYALFKKWTQTGCLTKS